MLNITKQKSFMIPEQYIEEFAMIKFMYESGMTDEVLETIEGLEIEKSGPHILKLAIWDGPNYKVIDFLLTSKFGDEFKKVVGSNQQEFMELAFELPDTKMLSILMENGIFIKPNEKYLYQDILTVNIVGLACVSGSSQMVDFIVERYNAKNDLEFKARQAIYKKIPHHYSEFTPLQILVSKNNLESTKLLIQKGANALMKNK